MSIIKYVGTRIRELRAIYGGGKGISQEELANAISVSTNTVSRWETATYRPAIEDLDKLARFFNVSILEFFPIENEQVEGRLLPLLRAAKDLPEDDLEELRRYAEFRKARHLLAGRNRPGPGRKRKE